jgi:hypothetical protein
VDGQPWFPISCGKQEKARDFNEELGKPLVTAGEDEIYIYSQLSDDGTENRLLCHSSNMILK